MLQARAGAIRCFAGLDSRVTHWARVAALPPTLLQIVVLEGGQVVEQGSHKQLLRSGGRYAALVSAQELTLQQTLM